MHFFKTFLLHCILILCQNKPINSNPSVKDADSTTNSISEKNKAIITPKPSEIDSNIVAQTATYYIVIADTGQNYFTLRNEMFNLNRTLKIEVDTMGRYYNKTKNLICLPDDDEDEIYAGDYFMRRYPSESFSLEYLNSYQNNAGENTIAIITGIYETAQKADSVLTFIKPYAKKAFSIKANIYMGCVH